MIVYRLEHPSTGVGPYMFDSAGLLDCLLREMWIAHNDNNHPSPAEEVIDFTPGVHFSGFASLGELTTWFEGYMPILTKVGFVVATYTVPDNKVLLGSCQLAFDRKDATASGCST